MNVLNALLVCSLVTLVSIGQGTTASTNTLSDAEIALCKIPALSSLLSYCAFIDRECVYTPWASWTPIRFATAKESKGKRCSGRPLVYQGTRWVSIGERSQCTASLTKTEVRCPPSTAEQIELFQEVLGGNFGRTPALAPQGPRPNKKGSWRSPAPPPLPVVTRDIALVLDGSSSVGRAAYNKMVDDLAELMGLLCYTFTRANAASDVRIALVVYSRKVHKVFDFRFSKLHHTSRNRIVSSIKRAKVYYTGQVTATGPALRYCYNRIFTRAAGMSQFSMKRVLLITDGYSNRGEKPVPVAEKLVRDKQVQVFPVGVGDRIRVSELVAMRQADGNANLLHTLILLPTFTTLSDILSTVRNSAALSVDRCQARLFKK
ncbi:uncharacterized protein LOC135809621 [Sycon ciliatum]|uniref:uncharacterized protein LOC135809621 n=1 Tax=Sycon ciliatum TaxID=27933 RepID=UPI0031F6AA31